MKKIKLLIQILTVISIASFSGAMFMLQTSLVSYWKQIPPGEFLNWFSNYSYGISFATGIFVKLCMLLPLITIFITWKIPTSRNYWIISYVFIIGIMIVTFSFFIEANTSFISKTINVKDVPQTVTTWGNLHVIRTVFSLISAFFAALGMMTYLTQTIAPKGEPGTVQ